MKNLTMKPLDFVKSREHDDMIGIITEIHTHKNTKEIEYCECSITWIGNNIYALKSAWWQISEIRIIDNLPNLLSRVLAHPFGEGKQYINQCYPLTR